MLLKCKYPTFCYCCCYYVAVLSQGLALLPRLCGLIVTTFLPLPSECWDYRSVSPSPATSLILKWHLHQILFLVSWLSMYIRMNYYSFNVWKFTILACFSISCLPTSVWNVHITKDNFIWIFILKICKSINIRKWLDW